MGGPITIHTKEGSSFPEFTIPEAGMMHFSDENDGLRFGVVKLTCQTVPPTGGSCVYVRFIKQGSDLANHKQFVEYLRRCGLENQRRQRRRASETNRNTFCRGCRIGR